MISKLTIILVIFNIKIHILFFFWKCSISPEKNSFFLENGILSQKTEISLLLFSVLVVVIVVIECSRYTIPHPHFFTQWLTSASPLAVRPQPPCFCHAIAVLLCQQMRLKCLPALSHQLYRPLCFQFTTIPLKALVNSFFSIIVNLIFCYHFNRVLGHRADENLC